MEKGLFEWVVTLSQIDVDVTTDYHMLSNGQGHLNFIEEFFCRSRWTGKWVIATALALERGWMELTCGLLQYKETQVAASWQWQS